MFRWCVAIGLLWLAFPAAAHAADASVLLYLQPTPREAARVTFEIDSVWIVSDQGVTARLDVQLRTVDAAGAARQRLLATGHVPAARYTRLSVSIRRASVKSERGPVTLATSDAPIVIPTEFNAAASRTSLLWVLLKYDGATADRASFNPEFVSVIPTQPVPARAAFVTTPAADRLLVVDKTAGQAVGAIDTCARPTGLALDQQRRRLYVLCSSADEVDVVDVASERLIERVPVTPGDAPREAALTPDGATLVVVNGHSNTVTFFRASPLTPLERVAVGSGPTSVAIDPAGARAFVFNTLASSISVLDIARHSLVATLSTDSAPLRGQFNATGDRLFVIYERSPYITVLDALRLTTVTRTRVRSGFDCIKADNRRNLLYIGSRLDTSIEFYNPTALLAVDAMSTPGGAVYLTIDVEEDRLWIVTSDAKRIVVGSLATRKVVSEIDVGDAPAWVSVIGEK